MASAPTFTTGKRPGPIESMDRVLAWQNPHVVQNFVGVPVKRIEDPRLLVGGGRYAEDLTRPGMAHAVIVRSCASGS